jgi:hypothetical protein
MLLESQIKEGQKLIDLLAENGIAVTAACWMKESDGGTWYLYLATPLVRKDGRRKPAYTRIDAVIDALPQPLDIDFFQIKVVGPSEPIAQAIREVQRRFVGKRGGWYDGGSLADVEIEGAYIYPPPVHKEAV